MVFHRLPVVLFVPFIVQCWFDCSCRCHLPTTTVEDVSAATEDALSATTCSGIADPSESAGGGRERVGQTAVAVAAQSEPHPCPRTNVLAATDGGGNRGEREDQDGVHGWLQMGADDSRGAGSKTRDSDLAVGGTVLTVIGGGAADAPAATGDEIKGRGAAPSKTSQGVADEGDPAAKAADAVAEDDAAAASAADVLSSAEPDAPSPRTAGGGAPESRISVGRMDLYSEGCATGEGCVSDDGMTAFTCPTGRDADADSTGCPRCAASCWFACSCACHADTAAAAPAAAAETVSGDAAVRASGAAGHRPCRRKRSRGERELAPPAEASSSRSLREGALAAASSSGDPRRAFLATSEGGAGPRTIHFGTAARFGKPSAGQDGRGGGVAPGGKGSGAQYDTR